MKRHRIRPIDSAVSLFSGVGGFDLALESNSVPVAASVEYDDHAAGVLRYRMPDTPVLGDVRDVTAGDLLSLGFSPGTGLVAASSPCQDFSHANTTRKGLSGGRSSVFHDFVRLLADTGAEWFIFENVFGLLTCNKGDDFEAVLRSLADVGYGVAWRVLDAQYAGVPQRRRRLWVVGRAGGRSGPAEVLGFGEDSLGNPGTVGGPQRGCDPRHDDPTAEARRLGVYVKSRRAQTKSDYETWGHSGVSATLNGFDVGASRSTVLVQRSDGNGLRRLMPLEMERLQGFPDDWTRWRTLPDGSVHEQSDSRRYTQMGNALAVPLAQMLIRRIVATAAPVDDDDASNF